MSDESNTHSPLVDYLTREASEPTVHRALESLEETLTELNDSNQLQMLQRRFDQFDSMLEEALSQQNESGGQEQLQMLQRRFDQFDSRLEEHQETLDNFDKRLSTVEEAIDKQNELLSKMMDTVKTGGNEGYGVDIDIVQGNIVAQNDIEAIVNPTNAALKPSGRGVNSSVHDAAGYRLKSRTKGLGPLDPGEVEVTKGFDLPNDYIFHCLGPRYGRDEPASELLAACYERTLRLAEEHDVESIAFPAISTGNFGYPFSEAASIALRTTQQHLDELESVERIRFVLYEEEGRDIYQAILDGWEMALETH